MEHAVLARTFAAEDGERIALSPFSMKGTLTAADNERGAAMASGTEQQINIVLRRVVIVDGHMTTKEAAEKRNVFGPSNSE